MKEIRVSARAVYLATAVALAAFVGGYAMAGALTIATGSPEGANGNYETTNGITWWTQSSVGLASTPGTVPTQLASSAASPTVLASAGQAYMANTGTSNDVAHFFKMTEATAAPTGTELEITFSVSTGTTPVVTTLTVYVETQASAPASALTFTIYYDLGSASSASIVLNSVQQISQQCGAVGTCP